MYIGSQIKTFKKGRRLWFSTFIVNCMKGSMELRCLWGLSIVATSNVVLVSSPYHFQMWMGAQRWITLFASNTP